MEDYSKMVPDLAPLLPMLIVGCLLIAAAFTFFLYILIQSIGGR